MYIFKNFVVILPVGNKIFCMKLTSYDIGEIVKNTRKKLGATQKDLALTSGCGLRFIIELEQGKQSCQLSKMLDVLHTLGIKISLTPPIVEQKAITKEHDSKS